ncbi:AgmX/PglI C-terminal domain-containing protein [Myxococcus sp. CA051A]|uniref:AgmX/PglI C-terminal domain-containing protein n=1 Tax=unclassified Myxococcus TaxID=2648731 RepID=UPI00157A2F7B|nr:MULTISPECIES: AgmX/PglI C-terminal domain-containing protein [unclassified Myxococcus]NTX15442.1 AgmX/PglI C-terminal domain-containing protein [Myxococcus sp. CA056]NTX39649.1 AgmX/PglI C-terminal domain-containing protein [Myxococcus sp. CA033]NTX61454.1 AgmX/PglI C-terminal domain-containing protein [Myxococcus sp. CA051A]
MSQQRSATRWVVLPLVCLGILVLLAAVAFWLTQPGDAPPPDEPPPPVEAPVRPEPTPPARRPPPVVPPPAFPSPQSAVPVLPGPDQPDLRRVITTEPVIESVDGDLRPEDIEAAIKAVTPLVQQCFEDSAQRNRGPQAVKLRFIVEARGGGTGEMRGGELLVSTIPDPMVQACVVDSLLDIGFPTPSRGGKATVVYPFEFRVPMEAGP